MSEILEALTKTEVWVSLCLGIIVPWLLKRLRLRFERFTQRLPEFKSDAAQKLKGWLKARLRKHLLKLKAKRFDQAAINREIAKAYAALVIFCVFGAFWLAFILLMKLDKGAVAVLLIPVLIAESIWLLKSAHVDHLIESAEKLRRNKGRIQRQLAQRLQIREEVADAARRYRHLTTAVNSDVVLDDDPHSGVIWLWSITRGMYGTAQCVAGYDFTYTFDKQVGKRTPSFKMSGKDFPPHPSWEHKRRAPAAQT